MLGWMAEKSGLTPMVERIDEVIQGKHIVITTSTRYTKLTIDGLELYFVREDGHYDGHGRCNDDGQK